MKSVKKIILVPEDVFNRFEQKQKNGDLPDCYKNIIQQLYYVQTSVAGKGEKYFTPWGLCWTFTFSYLNFMH